jgi:excinuclease ABC subunit B
MSHFKLVADYTPAGDQPKAIQELVTNAQSGEQFQVLMGVTGSGKTFTMANVIQQLGRPTLILTHNKTLAAQLYQEFTDFFPENAVEYFVSYYDYYQPEAYVVASDTFIEKDASINEEIEKLRMRTTTSLLTRKDVIVVASVSCIYGLGSPEVYRSMMMNLQVGQEIERDEILRELIRMQYNRNDYDVVRSCFRVRGDVIEVHPAYEDFGIRIELFGDEIDRLSRFHLVSGEVLANLESAVISPARHYVTDDPDMDRILRQIKADMLEQVKKFEQEQKFIEAQRISSRTRYDMEMLKETGMCSGIENYSRIIENRPPGSRPGTLIDFFQDEWLMFIDESHVSVPQVGGMHAGDRSRKTTLVEYGFRLPCALDNRPMNFSEFEQAYANSVIFVSATPGDYEMKKTEGVVVEQIIRPTGLLDPVIEIHPVQGQVTHLIESIGEVTAQGDRVLVTTLTKKMAEDLTEFLREAGILVKYMHSDIDTMERSEIIKGLREGEFHVLVGINLLREGLDLPEVSLVAILDADKEGFLRHYRALIQTMGRAARHINGKALLYADKMTDSLKLAVEETKRRRAVQQKHNEEHGITPRSVSRKIAGNLKIIDTLEAVPVASLVQEPYSEYATPIHESSEAAPVTIELLTKQMQQAAQRLDFETAAKLRDQIKSMS